MTEKKLEQILKNQARIEDRLENIEMLLVKLVSSNDSFGGEFETSIILETLEDDYKKLSSEVNIDKVDEFVKKNNMKQVQNFVKYALPIDSSLEILANTMEEEEFSGLPVSRYIDVAFKLNEILMKYEDNQLFQKFLKDLEKEFLDNLPF